MDMAASGNDQPLSSGDSVMGSMASFARNERVETGGVAASSSATAAHAHAALAAEDKPSVISITASQRRASGSRAALSPITAAVASVAAARLGSAGVDPSPRSAANIAMGRPTYVAQMMSTPSPGDVSYSGDNHLSMGIAGVSTPASLEGRIAAAMGNHASNTPKSASSHSGFAAPRSSSAPVSQQTLQTNATLLSAYPSPHLRRYSNQAAAERTPKLPLANSSHANNTVAPADTLFPSRVRPKSSSAPKDAADFLAATDVPVPLSSSLLRSSPMSSNAADYEEPNRVLFQQRHAPTHTYASAHPHGSSGSISMLPPNTSIGIKESKGGSLLSDDFNNTPARNSTHGPLMSQVASNSMPVRASTSGGSEQARIRERERLAKEREREAAAGALFVGRARGGVPARSTNARGPDEKDIIQATPQRNTHKGSQSRNEDDMTGDQTGAVGGDVSNGVQAVAMMFSKRKEPVNHYFG